MASIASSNTSYQGTSKTSITFKSFSKKLTVSVINEAIRLLNREYISEIDPNKLLDGAISGMSTYLKEKGSENWNN